MLQGAGRQFPVGLRIIYGIGEREPASQRLERAAAAGDQDVGVRLALRVACPHDFATWRLQVDDEIDCAADHRPHPLEERLVTGTAEVMQDPDRDIRDLVAVLSRVGDLALDGGHWPPAVVGLRATQPLVRLSGRLEIAADGHRHRALDVIPRIGVTAWEPRDFA